MRLISQTLVSKSFSRQATQPDSQRSKLVNRKEKAKNLKPRKVSTANYK